MMRVLGVDPGSHLTGWGVVEAAGSQLRRVASGVLRCTGDDLPCRLRTLADGLDIVLARYQPEAVSVETVFFAKDSQSAIKLGQARGVALLCVARFGAPVYEYTAGQIKRAATGRGRAGKDQVQVMVKLLLGLQDKMGLDESDALAAAICHAQMHSVPTSAALAMAAKESKRRSSPGRGRLRRSS